MKDVRLFGIATRRRLRKALSSRVNTKNAYGEPAFCPLVCATLVHELQYPEGSCPGYTTISRPSKLTSGYGAWQESGAMGAREGGACHSDHSKHASQDTPSPKTSGESDGHGQPPSVRSTPVPCVVSHHPFAVVFSRSRSPTNAARWRHTYSTDKVAHDFGGAGRGRWAKVRDLHYTRGCSTTTR